MNNPAKMLADWQVRVIEEKEALGEKINSLENFIELHRGAITKYDWQDLTKQQKVMREYYSILCNRIRRF